VSGRRLVTHSLIYTLGSLLINGGNFLLIPVYARYLEPAEYGIWGSLTVFNTMLVAVLGFGINGIVTRYYYEFADRNRWRRFFGTISTFVICFGFIVALLLSLFGEPLLDHIFKSVRFNPYLRLAVWVGYLSVIPVIALALLQAKQKVLVYRIFTTVSFIFLASCTLVMVVVSKLGVLGVLYGSLVSGVAMGGVYAYCIWREGLKTVSMPDLRTALVFGLPVMAYTISGSATELASRYFVERFTTLAELGVYNLAQQYASGLIVVVTAISMAWTPIFFESATQPDAPARFAKFGLRLTGLVIALALLMSLCAPAFLSLVSTQYAAAEYIIPLILVSYVFGNGLWILMITPIVYAKETRRLPWLTMLSGGICILFSVTLIPRIGLLGAAIAQLLGYISLIAAAYRAAQSAYPIPYPLATMAMVLLAAIGVFCLSLVIAGGGTTLQVLVKLALFGVFLLLLWQLRVVSTEDLVHIRQRMRKPVPRGDG
jgi:O-antigen/teichoic acid export membrane protein